MDYQRIASDARQGLASVSIATTAIKNRALQAIADSLGARRTELLKANLEDLRLAHENHLDAALLDRLELNDSRVEAMIEGVLQIEALPDPVGEMTRMTKRPSGIEVGLMRQPLGVIGIIYESRPNVTVDAAALC